MSAYVTDTHPLLWYAAGERSKPSQKVLQIFEAAESEQALVYVPAVVVWETTLVPVVASGLLTGHSTSG